MRPKPISPEPGQESVWDYPRPPALEPSSRRLTVILGDKIVAETTRGYRVLETSHPPGYYFPPEDVDQSLLVPVTGASFCEWKGQACYFTVRVGSREATRAAWRYDEPTPKFAALAGYLSFYPGRFDVCRVDDETVEPQPGDFYGGWITSHVVGPFKGISGSWGW